MNFRPDFTFWLRVDPLVEFGVLEKPVGANFDRAYLAALEQAVHVTSTDSQICARLFDRN